MNKIFLTGDTHGSVDIHKLSNNNWPEQKELTKRDYLIILGDFGLPFLPTDAGDIPLSGELKSRQDTYKYWIKWLSEKPYTILFVDGNHDNHPYWNSLPSVTWHGGRVHKHPDADNVIHLKRGEIFNIAGKVFFAMGGADSVDKYNRMEGFSWWAEEMPSKKEYNRALKQLEKVNFKVDYVLSHCCGTQFLHRLNTMHPYADELTDFFWNLERIYRLDFKKWFFGHHHIDVEVDEQHICLYNDIIRLQ